MAGNECLPLLHTVRLADVYVAGQTLFAAARSCREHRLTNAQMKIYHALPAGLQSGMATLRGHILQWWRYDDNETPVLIAQARERETWSRERWADWQRERLTYVLNRAATQVPYYRAHWEARRRAGDSSSWLELANWPVLEKDMVRQNAKAFVADDCTIRRMFKENSSGTTGKPIDFWATRKSVREWYALFEGRWRNWNGVGRGDPWAIIGGQLVVPVRRKRPPFWIWNSSMQQLYLSAYHLSPASIPSYLEAMNRRGVRFLWGYSSALYALAQGAIEARMQVPTLQVAISNAEPLLGFQRDLIGQAFGCEVRETYGMTETVAAAAECNFGALHLWPEVGYIEILRDGIPMPAGSSGEIVSTGLLNADMPLIRYRVGDTAVLGAPSEYCACGRTLPLLRSVEGRNDDILFTADGRRIGRLDPVFKAGLHIREAQIIQESLDRVRIRFVPGPDYEDRYGRQMISRLCDRMGDIQVVLEPVDAVARGANGKFRAVVCALSPEERRKVREGAHSS